MSQSDTQRSGQGVLQFRLAVIIAIIIVSLTVGIMSLVRYYLGDTIRSSAADSLRLVAVTMSDRLENGLYERYMDLVALSASPMMQRVEGNEPEVRAFFERQQSYYPEFSWIGFVAPDGTVLSATGGLLVGKNIMQRDWVSKGLQESYVGDVHDALLLAKLLPGNADGEPLRLFDIALPIKNSRGETIGVLGAHLSWAWAKRIRESVLSSTSLKDHMNLYILSDKGKVLLAPELDQVGRDLSKQISVMEARRTGNGHVPEIFNGEPGITAFARGQGKTTFSGLHWTVIVQQPDAVVMKALDDIRLPALSFATLLGLIAIASALYFIGRLITPMHKIVQTAQGIADGGITTLPDVTGEDEFSEFSRTLFHLVTTLKEKESAQLRLAESLRGELNDRRMAEDRLREMKNTLEIRVLERTADLNDAITDARKAREMAEQAMRAKSEFLGTISHEIRTPLSALVGILELAASCDTVAEQKKLIAVARQAADALLHIVNDILDLSRIDTGQFRLTEENINIHEVFASSVSLFASSAQEKGVLLTLAVDSSVPEWAQGDATRLKQILYNLLSNAVKYTRKGEISVRVERMKGDGVALLCRVKDTGIGMSPERLVQLFGDGDMAAADTGLGVTVSKKLVKRMHGDLFATSEAGAGTEITFTVRLKEGEKPSADSASSACSMLHMRKLHLLVVDDNALNRILALRIFEQFGHRVTLAESGDTALKLLSSDRFDMVFIDIKMPGMDGFQTLHAIRNPGTGVLHHQIPVIAMTALAAEADRAECLKAGMDGYIAKPFTLPAVEEILCKYAQQPAGEAHRGAGQKEKQVNRLRALEKFGYNNEIYDSLLAVFMTSSRSMLKDIEKAVEEQDAELFFRTVHSVKSNTAAVGADAVSSLAEKIEADARSGTIDTEDAAKLVAMMQSVLAEMEEDADAN